MRVLFLCTGNYYRSRFAEELLRARCACGGLPAQPRSRGLRIVEGQNPGPISRHAREALAARGIALAEPARAPRRVTEADLAWASEIVALYEDEHRPMIAEAFPDWVDRVEYWSVPDLRDLPPRVALARIEREVERLATRLERAAEASDD